MALSIPNLAVSQRVLARAVGYRVLDSIGRGGNSVVYLVEALGGPNRGMLFALKLLFQITKSDRLARFEREIAFLKKCDHPAIMRIHDSGIYPESTVDGVSNFPFIIVDFLPQTLLEAHKVGLTMIEKLSYCLQLLSGLTYLASRDPKVVHRDIKPENIFVRGKSCILGDFGLIKLLTNESDADDKAFMAESAGIRMPRFYRTPDLVDYCKDVGPLTTKSDVFQLGLVFAWLFTGTNPLQEPAGSMFDPVLLNPLQPILGSQANAIQGYIARMLEPKAHIRPSAEDLFDPWEGSFLEAVKLSHSLDGRVFPS